MLQPWPPPDLRTGGNLRGECIEFLQTRQWAVTRRGPFDLSFLIGFVYFPEQVRHIVWVSPSQEEEKERENEQTGWRTGTEENDLFNKVIFLTA